MPHDTNPYYNRALYPHFVVNHGNWDIYANDTGYCAALPSKAGEAAGCSASHYGDMQYVRVTLARELAELEASKAFA